MKSKCNFPHYVDQLHNVEAVTVDQLSQICSCGEQIIYSPNLVFMKYEVVLANVRTITKE